MASTRKRARKAAAARSAKHRPAPPRRSAPTATRRERFLIVGLGASAGGLQALEAFFTNVPPETGMAFVVITHQHPDRTSLLPELLARKTTMPVVGVAEPTSVERDHVYLAQPGWQLDVVSAMLMPSKIDARSTPALPIDRFFRSLAASHHERAVGIVLSGTGTDGTLGLQAIKDELGMVMVQDEASAQYAGMPHSAIATRLVDYVLPVSAMPEQLIAYARDVRAGRPLEARASESLEPLFALIKARTGHDFSGYKATTIRRRVERRMQMHRFDSVARYARYLQSSPGEIDLLCKELLIGVTSFFRDPEAWDALAAHLPDALAGKPADYVVRAWVAGCSTGEEAYSLAIVLRECMARLGQSWTVQVFATDLDADAVRAARTGEYPVGVVNDVSAERIARFFTRVDDTYQLRKDVREMVVFAPHNLAADPPFTKIDVLSCRNLLIYFEPELQRRLTAMFHYALRPAGLLFLGTSETLGGSAELFEPLDQRWKVFRRRAAKTRRYAGHLPINRRGQAHAARDEDPVATEGSVTKLAERTLLRELVPPTVLVRERGDIVYIHGRTGMFLEPAPGPQGSANIFNMAREGLQTSLSAAMRKCVVSGDELVRGVKIKANGTRVALDLHVVRLTEPEGLRGLYRITFDHASASSRDREPAAPGDRDEPADRLGDVERELQYAKESHRIASEELETSNEQLTSANEELQSTNEELQSSNEELETSKEELQSLNEELQTVNSQLQGKLDELSQVNDDMRNLLNGTEIATVFVDGELRIKRFTDQAKAVFRLIASDVGRPLGDLTSSLRYARLLEDAREVLRTLATREAEIQGDADEWYLMRILPYRTGENLIDGLVLTFVDITKSRALKLYERRLLTVLDASTTSIFGHDRQLRYRWTLGAVLGRSPPQLEGKTDTQVFGDAGRPMMELKRRVVATGSSERARFPFAVDGVERHYEIYIEPVRDDQAAITGLSCMITEDRKEK